MQSDKQEPNFLFQNQPSFLFQSSQSHFLEPQFDKLHITSKKQTEQTLPRICKMHIKKIKRLQQKVKDLEHQVRQLKRQKQQNLKTDETIIPMQSETLQHQLVPPQNNFLSQLNKNCLLDIQQQQQALQKISPCDIMNFTPGNLQFQQFQITPQPPIQQQLQLNGQSWIIMGMLMVLMGVNINGYGQVTDVYKVTRQTVDSIRKQVQKSSEQIVFPVFYSKLFNLQQITGMQPSSTDGCFQLQGLRLQSINQQDLMFQQHLNFRLKYEALIVMMEYMKQYASLN